MKKLFSGYYSEELSFDLLKKSVIVISYEVLCSLYCMPIETAKQLIRCIAEIKEQLWLPYIIAEKYHRMSNIVIDRYFNRLQDVLMKIVHAKEALDAIPYTVEHRDWFNATSDCVASALRRRMVEVRGNIKKKSVIKNQIACVFEDKVGQDNSDPAPESFDIFQYKVKDTAAPIVSEASNNNEGNYEQRLLHSLIDLSKSKDKNIVYITSTLSAEWSLVINKTSYGLKPEISTYFSKKTQGHQLFCITFWTFLSLLKSYGIGVPASSLSFVKKLTYEADNTVNNV